MGCLGSCHPWTGVVLATVGDSTTSYCSKKRAETFEASCSRAIANGSRHEPRTALRCGRRTSRARSVRDCAA